MIQPILKMHNLLGHMYDLSKLCTYANTMLILHYSWYSAPRLSTAHKPTEIVTSVAKFTCIFKCVKIVIFRKGSVNTELCFHGI